MEKFRILQIGDVHFSDEKLNESSADLKDRRFPAQVASLATSKPLQSSVRLMVEAIEKKPVDAIVLVGDLTDRGCIHNYKRCISYLKDVLGLGSISLDAIHCVPGNHDIASREIQSQERSEQEVWDKFYPLRDEWNAISLPVLATDKARTTVIRKGKAAVRLTSLNSCIGCGEYRALPKEIRLAIKGMVESAGNESQWKLGEQLDTPCFADDHLTDAATQVAHCDRSGINIIVAHHNLLPQSTPRIAPYGELINGGYFRTMLEKAKSPIIYCHGHIHADPIEMIGSACTQPSKLLTVSAPELHQGFNIVEISLTRDGVPLGIEVQQYRISATIPFSLNPSNTTRIPFKKTSDYRSITDSNRLAILQLISSSNNGFAAAIFNQAKQFDVNLDQESFEEILEEMQWHELIRLENHDSAFHLWRISYLMS